MFAAGNGGEVDRKAILPFLVKEKGDVFVYAADQTAPSGDELKLAQIPSPFLRCLEQGTNLNEQMHSDPTGAGKRLDDVVDELRGWIRSSLAAGADGVFYIVTGACSEHCSPMEYGGFYLERDRELLSEASSAPFNVLFVAGEGDVYFDFICDLPAHVMAWDSARTGFSSQQMRQIRLGAQASADPKSEIQLLLPEQGLAQLLEKKTLESV